MWNMMFPIRIGNDRKAERQVNLLQLDIFQFGPRCFVR